MGLEYSKAMNLGDGGAQFQKEIKTLTLGERLSEINNRLYNINSNINDYERAIGEYANSMDELDSEPGEPSPDTPSISELIKQISCKLSWIETTCDNLNRHIAR